MKAHIADNQNQKMDYDPKTHFKCAICKEVFEKELTDEEALEQLSEEFPGKAPEECGVVCDDCFKALFPFYEQTEG